MNKTLVQSECGNIYISRNFFFTLFLIFYFSTQLFAQTIAPQRLPFTKICAQSDFNTFDADFIYTGFPVSTTFVVELSDYKGSFVNPVATTTISTVEVSSTEEKITFAVPTNLIGSENYKLRVKSSTGVISGTFSSFDLKLSFPAYYKPFSNHFFINNQLPSVNICNGGNVILTIDNNTPNIPDSSPANYPLLKYKWYKNKVIIPAETSNSLTVNTVGVYYAELDYGSCSDVNFNSQEISVNVTSGGSASITSSLSNPFCPSIGPTTLTATLGNSYVWLKNNIVIPNAKNQTYTTSVPGKYSVVVDFGGCKSKGDIDLQSFQIVSSIDTPVISTIGNGETKTVTTTSNAVNPSYQWFLNDNPISGATASSYDVIDKGDYKVIVTQNSGCKITNELPFKINTIIDLKATNIPNLISPNNDGINDTWVIPQEYLSSTEIILMNSLGEVVLKTSNYLNDWPENTIDFKNINPVYYYIITAKNGVKKGSITIVK